MARVLVGMPVYNGERYIAAHIQAFLDQTFEDFELIVGDNASTDGTEDICREFASRDPRIRYQRRDRNLGAAANVNLLIEACQCEYFKLAAYDDMHARRYLERCVDVLDWDSSVVLSYTGICLIDEAGVPLPLNPKTGNFVDFSGRVWALDPRSRRMSSTKPNERYHDMIHHTILVAEIWGVMRHSALMKTKRFLPYFGSDRPMLAEVALAGQFYQVQETLFSLRLHPTNTTRQSWRTRGDAVAPMASALSKRFSGLQTFRDFGRAIWNADLSSSEKARCYWSWFMLLADRRIISKIFLPGPHNFFGINVQPGRTFVQALKRVSRT